MSNKLYIFFVFLSLKLIANQTDSVSYIWSGDALPFDVNIELADISLPIGFHSGAVGIDGDKWLFIAGRTNGMHGFNDDNDNFPPDKQNTDIIVVDIAHNKTYYRSLYNSDLTHEQIEDLSVTSPQSYQRDTTLYISGGYVLDRSAGKFLTKGVLTVINIPGLIRWVIESPLGDFASDHIRQLRDPIFQITGGYMDQVDNMPTLLIFGQDFTGAYRGDSNGIYSQQIRRFCIIDDGECLKIEELDPRPDFPKDEYRRRDLNIVPALRYNANSENLETYFVALSGVFTLDGGAWTVPVIINSDGFSRTFDPNNFYTFKQGMNNYVCANAGLFSCAQNNMYVELFGGISYGYFDNNIFKTDPELPFINQVTTIKINSHEDFTQYIMDAVYPTILSTTPVVGNPLLFGAGAMFINNNCLETYNNNIINYDALPEGSSLIGYIAGGIQSTLPNTTDPKLQSTASKYIFKVILDKKY